MNEKLLAAIKNGLYAIVALLAVNAIFLFMIYQKFSEFSVSMIGK
jgi:hypothetical protein